MSYLQVTASHPSLRVSNQYNGLRGSAIQCIAPVNVLHSLCNSLKPTISSSMKSNKLRKCLMIQRAGPSRYQQCTPVCLFGGKGESRNDNETSPWKSIEKAMSGLKKEQSLEDVLRQQMERQEYYDGDGGGNDGGGDGGGGGSEFGGTGEGGFAEFFEDLLQIIMAILALIVVYLFVVAGERVKLFLSDAIEFVAGKRGPRLRTIMYVIDRFYRSTRRKVYHDPFWLEKAIITTPTWWDSPRKYRQLLRSSRRALRSSTGQTESESDENGYNDGTYKDKSYNEDRKSYGEKAYSDDENNENAYSEDVDD